MLQYTAICYNMLQYITIWCDHRQVQSELITSFDRSTFPPLLLLPTSIKYDIVGKEEEEDDDRVHEDDGLDHDDDDI